ncbi:MAG: Dam family site-specific DNA-(adenine-N6)-methyltransferase [Chloroflexi bacterium]|nr:Dam family site-specific DNA-(adenine-N6)-methyltransferase [Chloroflexota bacterium]
MQPQLFAELKYQVIQPFSTPLLKWIGNKQRYAAEIISHFPSSFGTYIEPFLGSGGVLGTLAPTNGIGSDSFKPLMEIWETLQQSPETLKEWYSERWERMKRGSKIETYEEVKAAYNARPNGADLLFLSRACYGGVVRFRQTDGYMSTPCGIHKPISPGAFSRRVDEWRQRTRGTAFYCMEYESAMEMAKPGDLIYCDPPYKYSQSILYKAQSFDLVHLLKVIDRCRVRGVYVAMSIDGSKRSGTVQLDLPIPSGLFKREVTIACGPSMLKRFQMEGKTLESDNVSDRLFLTY